MPAAENTSEDGMSQENYGLVVRDAQAKLAAALAEAQREIGSAAKDSKNPHFNSRYADLASVWDAWQKVGPKNGLAVVQLPRETDRQGILLTTILMHKDGGEVGTTAFFPATKADAQAYGSALTYARRYMLAALVGVCPDDDDGNAASGKAPASVRPAAPPADFIELATTALAKHAKDAVKITHILNEAKKCGATGVVAMAEKALAALEPSK